MHNILWEKKITVRYMCVFILFFRKLRMGYGGLLRMNPVFSEYGLKDLLPLKLDIPDEGCTRPNKSMYCFEAGNLYFLHIKNMQNLIKVFQIQRIFFQPFIYQKWNIKNRSFNIKFTWIDYWALMYTGILKISSNKILKIEVNNYNILI